MTGKKGDMSRIDSTDAGHMAALATNIDAAMIMVEQATLTANRVMQAADAAARTVEGAAPSSIELFGSFFLGSDEFALPAQSIREVVNMPEKITAIPLSPPILEGVFTLRGAVIPVLNLHRIFDPAAPAVDPSHKIAILDHQNVQIGLVFHQTGEILRVRAEQRNQLHYPDSSVHSVVAGTIRLNDGARLLQILDPAALVRIENVPQILALKSSSREDKNHQFQRQAERRQCVSFRVGGTAFAFEMHAIQEIINVPELKNSVLHSKLCIGRINLRGQPLAVVDFARLLNFPEIEAPKSADQRIVIARINDAAIGLLVDSVDNIFSFFPGDLLPIPLLGKTRAGMFGGCLHKDGIGEVLYLQHDAIFSHAEITELTKGHTNLYRQEAQTDAHGGGKAGNAGHRQAYITFSVEHAFAVEIKQIREIIDFSGEMLRPPNLPPFIHGILNLRRQMVTIVDLRRLYGLPPAMDASHAKIMVFERGNERYGLMVDAVENIVTVNASDRIPTPKVLMGTVEKTLRNEMQEVINIFTDGDAKQTLSVFDIDIFLERLMRDMATV